MAHEDSMKKMGIITDRVVNVGGFAELLPTIFSTDVQILRIDLFMTPLRH